MQPQLPIDVDPDTGVWTTDALPMLYVPRHFFTNNHTAVEEALGRKTYIANRSKLGALAEYWYGAHRGISDLIYLSIGTGVSAGIVHQGKLFLGSNSSAGEVGHLTIVPDGPLCPCGNHGCLQEYVSHAAIVRFVTLSVAKLLVMMMTVFLKSTRRPSPSESMPLSNTW